MPCCGAEPAGAPAILTQRAARGESGRLWRRSSRACRRRLMSGKRLLDRHVFNVVEQCLTTALFTARADGGSASPAQQDFCKACLWQVIDASIDLRDPNPN